MARRIAMAAAALTLTLGCNPGGAGINRNLKPSPLPDGASSDKVAECERRLRMMRQQDADSRANPEDIVDSANHVRRPIQDFPDGENPCRVAARDSGEEELGEAEQELEDRRFAKIRARAMLDSARPLDARDALRGAFGLLTPDDPEVGALTRSVASSYLAMRRDAWSESGKIGVVIGGASGCVFSRAPIEGSSSFDRATFLFDQPSTTVHVTCAISERAARGKRDVTSALLLRRRVGPTRYVDVDRVDLGKLSAYSADGLARASFEVRLPADATRAYYDAVLTLDGVPEAESVIARDGFFVVTGD